MANSLQGHGLSITQDAPKIAIVRLRGATTPMLAALGSELGVAWSDAPNTCARGSNIEVCWLGPGEWAVVGASLDRVQGAVETQCAGCLHHVAEMSDAWARWRLSGAAAEDLLARGCSLDLQKFDASHCTRTLLGQVNIVLVRQADAWDIYAEHALAAHMRAWFLGAGRTFELQEIRAS